MTGKPTDTPAPKRRKRGFERAASLMTQRIRQAGESRGFAVSRLLTHWPETVGEDVAATARPVKVHYGREGFGATLTLLTTGARAPMLEMQKEKILERVNAVYGYAAISTVRITQTAPTGFAEGQAQFAHAPKKQAPRAPSPEVRQAAQTLSRDVQDDGLRAALDQLACNVLSRRKDQGDTQR